ncbi:snaclec convulxin subunit beta-like [Scomber scombrus]|uniref:Snaclec convulxin subunit beta-like n=1 Tax=Scomber scombrus TaxID=13677 RepID=A0AAV1N4F0_SCOSC
MGSAHSTVPGRTRAHTEPQTNSWWMIELDGVYNVSYIIYNKQQGYFNMDIAQIFIGNSTNTSSSDSRRCKTIKVFQRETNYFKCDEAVLGRYVHVSFPQQNLVGSLVATIYGERQDSPFVLVKQNMTWENALYYCRDNDMDLASITDKYIQVWAKLEAEKADTEFVWLGLHYTCTLEFWFWVNGHDLKFDKWAQGEKTEDCGMSAVMDKNGTWFRGRDNDTFNFICTK